jgi:hypothetical protein
MAASFQILSTLSFIYNPNHLMVYSLATDSSIK